MKNKQPAASNSDLSEKGQELFKKALLYADEFSFKEGVSDDMMAVLISIVNKVLDGIAITYPDIFDSLNETQLAQFKNGFYESIGVGYKVYWAERKYLKNEDDFIKFKGSKYQSFLLNEYQAYFVDFTKDPEPLTPSYVMEVINQFGLLMFKGGYVEGDKIELIKKLAGENGDNGFLEKVNIVGLLKSFILTGYILCKSQDKYRTFAGVPASKNRGLVQ